MKYIFINQPLNNFLCSLIFTTTSLNLLTSSMPTWHRKSASTLFKMKFFALQFVFKLKWIYIKRLFIVINYDVVCLVRETFYWNKAKRKKRTKGKRKQREVPFCIFFYYYYYIPPLSSFRRFVHAVRDFQCYENTMPFPPSSSFFPFSHCLQVEHLESLLNLSKHCAEILQTFLEASTWI